MGQTKPLTRITDLLDDLFGRWFKDESWYAWKVLLKATFGAHITKKELKLFCKYTGRKTVPKNVRELWAAVGRRGGKSRIAGVIAVILAFFIPWDKILAPGEKGHILLIYPDRKQGRVTMNYILAFIEAVPMFTQMVERQTKDSIYLTNGIVIEIATCNFRTVRGYTVVAAICDEIAYWRSEDSANPDYEILTALRPAMSTVANSLLICISSPYARRGDLWKAYQKHYGKEDDNILVWQADTRSMNPTVPQSVIDRAYEEDLIAAAAEFGGQFRRDVEALIPIENAERVINRDRSLELPFSGKRAFGFLDTAGGSGSDSMTGAVAHREGEKLVLDCVQEIKPPFNPMSACREFAEMFHRFKVTTVQADRYAGDWPKVQFKKYGIDVRPSKLTKSEIYLELMPLINSEQVELPNHKRLTAQLCGLERRTSRAGRDSIDHAPGGHDDIINSVAGAVVLAARYRRHSLTWGRDLDNRDAITGSLTVHEYRVIRG